jgi:hypothetical protein
VEELADYALPIRPTGYAGDGMQRFTDAGRHSFKEGNVYAGLSLALTLPDICASLEDPGPGKSQKRYERWCRQWLQPKFTSPPGPFRSEPWVWITAEDVFQLRCSLIHSGRAEIEPSKRTGVDRFLFFDQSAKSHMMKFENCSLGGVTANLVQVKADLFSEEVFKAVDEWDASVAGDTKIQAEKAKLLFIHSGGALIHGIQFG